MNMVVGYKLDSKLSGETMILKVLKKINTKLKLLCRQNQYLTPVSKGHLDWGYFSWFPLLEKNLESKLQNVQNKCIYFT